MNMKQKLVLAGAAAVAVAAAGGALASTKLGSPREENQAIVNDAAQQLGVEPSKLSAALKKALEDRVDAAVEAGRLTKEQGDELKSRIESGELPLFASPHGPGFRHGGPFGPFGDKLDAAATYLGLSEDALRQQLTDGKTLAQVTKDRGKSVDGLVDALLASEKEHLDDAVSEGRITKAEEQDFLAGLRTRITNLVNSRLGPPPAEWGPRGFGFRAWS